MRKQEEIQYYSKVRAQGRLLNIYLDNPYTAVGIAAKRDWNRLIQDLYLSYPHIHKIGVYVPESEYQPDPVRDVPLTRNKIPEGQSVIYPPWTGRDLGVD